MSINPCLTIFKLLLKYTLPKSSCVARQVHNNRFLHFFRRLYMSYCCSDPYENWARTQCRPYHTHTLGPHGYGLANLTLFTHTPYEPVRTGMVHINEPQHNKIYKLCAQWRLRSAWASVQSDKSLRSLCAQWIGKNTRVLHADSEGFDHTVRMPSLIWVFAGRTGHFFCFVVLRLK